MQAAISRMAAASAPTGEAAWQTAAFPATITGDPWELEGALSALADVYDFICFLLVGLGHSFHEVVPPGTSRGRESAEDPERNPSALLRELELFYLTLSRPYLAPVIHWLRPNSFTRNEF